MKVLIKTEDYLEDEFLEIQEEFKIKGMNIILSDEYVKGIFDYVIITKADKPFIIEKEFKNRTKELYIGIFTSFKTQEHNVFPLQAPITPVIINTILNNVLIKRNLEFKIPINPQLLKQTSFKATCNIYLKLNKTKFVKVYNKGEVLSDEDIQKYYLKGVQNLYVDPNEYSGLIAELFKTKKPIVNELLNSLLLDIGINQKSIAIIEDVANLIIDESSSPVARLFAKILMKKEGDYSYNHSYLLSVLFTNVSKELGWNDEIIRKGIVSAFIHDVAIEKNELIFLHDTNPSSINNAYDEDKELVDKHATRMSELLTLDKTIPDDIISIVKHHETLPNEPSSIKPFRDLKQIDILFIVVHEYIIQIYKSGFSKVQLKFINELITNQFKDHPFASKVAAILSKLKPL